MKAVNACFVNIESIDNIYFMFYFDKRGGRTLSFVDFISMEVVDFISVEYAIWSMREQWWTWQSRYDDLVFLFKMLSTNWFQSLNDSPHSLRPVTGNLIIIFTLFVKIFCESVLCFCVVFQTPNKRIGHWQAWPIINIFSAFKDCVTSYNPPLFKELKG